MSERPDITLSEDRLRAILAEFKLDLIERLTRELSRKADLVHVDALEKRMDLIEERGRAKYDSLNTWRWRTTGAISIIAALTIPAAVAVFTQTIL